ncbi:MULTISPECIES: master DNA invertase Mpi family serine-type recombinase [Weeksella]|uniref:master DNA invertase Mpi family serine-type recombinase n=1 Tax=Weeksella TaxID=1013 RepID=UPI0008A15414|nr:MULTISPECIES: master DNA invertase Mpi family serine-type recombinase [Weeksella]MDK7376147.1 master DNA invertase Mpi family serine-type recombinase [Weeksella virosa]OFM84550.1 invertase [Weeksella sp. HMSC059D05]
MIYGYIRVSTDRQDTENQKIGINNKAKSLGFEIEEWISDDGVSGTKEPDKRLLGKLLKNIKPGDVIISSELSRLGRNLFMVMRILEHCMKNEVKVYTVKDGYELGDNVTSKVLAFAFALAAEIERDMISKRTKEALARKKAEGIHIGRPKGRLSDKVKLTGKEETIKKHLEKGMSQVKLSKKLGVARGTLARFIKRESI